MGNCGGILCNKNNNNNFKTNSDKIRTDIVLETKIDKESLEQIYSQIPLINKVIYLQKKIRNYLKKHKSKMRKNKINNSNKKAKIKKMI